MKPPKRKRVSETFEATVHSPVGYKGKPIGAARLKELILEKFVPGDRVRVEVTKLERGK